MQHKSFVTRARIIFALNRERGTDLSMAASLRVYLSPPAFLPGIHGQKAHPDKPLIAVSQQKQKRQVVGTGRAVTGY